MRVTRLLDAPIIWPDMDERMGANINGPSLVRVPDWVDDPLGRYYLFFAHHDGAYIRLAYADAVEGPWHIHSPGVMDLEASGFAGHIASPDVLIDDASQQFRMYFHGCENPTLEGGPQHTRVALSDDGLSFEAAPELLGPPYFRVFRMAERWYALAMPGDLFESSDGLSGFQRGPTLNTPDMRHAALHVEDGTAHIVYTNAGDCPERLLTVTMDVSGPFASWRSGTPQELLRPERDYEGADVPLVPSVRGIAFERKHELRDPAIYVGPEGTFLLYAVAGESGIALARIESWH